MCWGEPVPTTHVAKQADGRGSPAGLTGATAVTVAATVLRGGRYVSTAASSMGHHLEEAARERTACDACGALAWASTRHLTACVR
jgi:hypothetical protein